MDIEADTVFLKFKFLDYDEKQLMQLLDGQISGHNIDDLSPKIYTALQMEEIRVGRESGKLSDIDPKRGRDV